jgi:Domain of unknown function (DUF4303)
MMFSEAKRNALIKAWVTACENAIAAEDFQSGRLYVVALGSLYAETGATIRMPSISANTVEALTEDHGVAAMKTGAALYDVKWNPPDWRWAELEPTARPAVVSKIEQHLNELKGVSQSHWMEVHAVYIETLVEICQQLAQRAANRIGPWQKIALAPDFVVFVHEDSGEGIDYLRKSVSLPQLKKLWPNYWKKLA